MDVLDLPGSENLLSNMETQTHEDLLLFTDTCTQVCHPGLANPLNPPEFFFSKGAWIF